MPDLAGQFCQMESVLRKCRLSLTVSLTEKVLSPPFWLLPLYVDFDECSEDKNNCSREANCTNIEGSYIIAPVTRDLLEMDEGVHVSLQKRFTVGCSYSLL